MSGNLLPINPHNTFEKKVSNFPDNLYDFNEGDNITTLMKILLGNSGTGQLNNLQTALKGAKPESVDWNNLTIKLPSLAKGIGYYDLAVARYLGEKIVVRLEHQHAIE
jgi:hypothetical protein